MNDDNDQDKDKDKVDSNDCDLLVQRMQIQLHFFSPKISNFQMDMTIGLKEDLKIKTENIMLYRFNDVFFPDNSYYNSDPLPVEWIEVFQENQIYKEKRKESQSKQEMNRSKEISLFPHEEEKFGTTLDAKSPSKYLRDYSSQKERTLSKSRK